MVGILVLSVAQRLDEPHLRRVAVYAATVPLLLLVAAWIRFDPSEPAFQLVQEFAWIPTLGVAWRGVWASMA